MANVCRPDITGSALGSERTSIRLAILSTSPAKYEIFQACNVIVSQTLATLNRMDDVRQLVRNGTGLVPEVEEALSSNQNSGLLRNPGRGKICRVGRMQFRELSVAKRLVNLQCVNQFVRLASAAATNANHPTAYRCPSLDRGLLATAQRANASPDVRSETFIVIHAVAVVPDLAAHRNAVPRLDDGTGNRRPPPRGFVDHANSRASLLIRPSSPSVVRHRRGFPRGVRTAAGAC